VTGPVRGPDVRAVLDELEQMRGLRVISEAPRLIAAVRAALDYADELNREADRTSDVAARVAWREAAFRIGDAITDALGATPQEQSHG
jgi:hypothetical protein